MSSNHLALEIGDNLQLQFVDDDLRHYVKVIGYVPGKSLLVTTPKQDGKFLLVREGQRVVVRLMSGNEIVGFTVAVLRSQVQPYPYLHLDFPKDMQAVTVRKALRVKLDMAASVRPCQKDTSEADSEQPARAVTLQDMSTSGALLVADKPLVSEGQNILLSLQLDVADSTEEITLLAVVRNIRPERGERAGERHYLHGVEFRLADRQQSILVHAFVYERIARGPS
jgi:c-di-GMP-binding flagellar brake protein YcgR